MHTETGRIVEVILADGCRYARLACPENLIPTAGQYLLASDNPHAPLPVPIFYTDSAPQGFIGTALDGWNPGQSLFLRGPFGRGFSMPVSSRKIGLVAFDHSPARLRGLIQPALRQGASLVFVSEWDVGDLPDEVEAQPLSALEEILQWSDYLAVDVDRDQLPQLKERLEKQPQRTLAKAVQVLVRTPIPCGGIADCGVCAVVTQANWQMACKDGPVFDLRDI